MGRPRTGAAPGSLCTGRLLPRRRRRPESEGNNPGDRLAGGPLGASAGDRGCRVDPIRNSWADVTRSAPVRSSTTVAPDDRRPRSSGHSDANRNGPVIELPLELVLGASLIEPENLIAQVEQRDDDLGSVEHRIGCLGIDLRVRVEIDVAERPMNATVRTVL